MLLIIAEMAPDGAKTVITHPTAHPVLPVGLAYDELPPGSDLRREYGTDGSVTISAPAGEPSAAARRAAAQGTGVSSAAVCAVVLGVLVWITFGVSDSVRRLDPASRAGAVLLFGVFSGALFLLVWKVRYATRLDMLAEARRQAAVLHAHPNRLLVETAGPFGERSFDVPAGEIRRMQVVGEPWSGDGIAAESVPCLRVQLTDGRVLRLMPGRHEAELRWAAAALGQALGKPGAFELERARPVATLWRRGLW
jgi:hypothetical protein